MSAWPAPRALLVQAALSEPVRIVRQQAYRARRLLRGEAAALDVFVQLDDPYSLLLLRELPRLLEGFDVELRMHWLAGNIPPDFEPNAERRRAYAPADAALLAGALGDTLTHAPALAMRDAVAARLVALTSAAADGWLERVLSLAEAWWAGTEETLTHATQGINTVALEVARQHSRDAVARLLRLGHYDTASVYFDGSWYVGIDRLHYLIERLDSLGRTQRRDAVRVLRARQRALRPPIALNQVPEIEFYYSFRSPFSYLAAVTTFPLAKAGRIRVQFRPVLPMVQRGHPLPDVKRYYLVADANREARRLGIPFGCVADPLDAAPNLIRLAALAEREERTAEFVLTVGRAAWAEGQDLRRAATLKAVARQAGLLPTAIERALADEAPLAAAADNMQRLNAAGLWGVPSFKLGSRAYFGQDRLALLLQRAAEEGA